MQLFIDWKVAANHWKPDCLIPGSWTPTAQHRIGPRHQDESLHKQPYIPDGSLHLISHHPGLFRPSTDFLVKARCHPPGPRKRLGGGQRTPGTVTQSRTCSSAPALAYLRAWAKGTRLLSTWSRSGKHLPSGGFTGRHKHNCSNEDLSCSCHEGICMGPGSLF